MQKNRAAEGTRSLDPNITNVHRFKGLSQGSECGSQRKVFQQAVDRNQCEGTFNLLILNW
jgi:hypothetical protein